MANKSYHPKNVSQGFYPRSTMEQVAKQRDAEGKGTANSSRKQDLERVDYYEPEDRAKRRRD